MNNPDYSEITESPGLQATQEQLERIYHRYHFAKQFAAEKNVIEIACGSGIGLSYLASVAKTVIGGDIDSTNIKTSKENCIGNKKISVEKIDAHQLPLADNSCDLVLLYEAIYYLQHPEKFIEESYRVLRSGGKLIICSVNKDWKDFHPSPFVNKYFSVPEFYSLLNGKFMNVKIYGAFKTETGIKAGIFSLIKRIALKLDLIPGSLKLRAYLKRIFIGKTNPLPKELHEGMAIYQPPVELDAKKNNSTYKIMYIVSEKLNTH